MKIQAILSAMILTTVAGFSGTPSVLASEEEPMCSYENNLRCPPGYRCQFRWAPGPYRCVKERPSSFELEHFASQPEPVTASGDADVPGSFKVSVPLVRECTGEKRSREEAIMIGQRKAIAHCPFWSSGGPRQITPWEERVTQNLCYTAELSALFVCEAF